MKSLKTLYFMKFVLASVLGFAILFSQFSSSVILLNYRLNSEAITQKYCVNKDKPQMKCNGKCHIKKQLEKSRQQGNKMNFSKENESAKLFVKKLQLNDVFYTAAARFYSPYVLNFHSAINDISTPPPRRIA